MPNWIEGTIKFRGNSENLKRFFAEGLEPSTLCFEHDQWNEVSIKDETHIKGTQKAFIQNCEVFWKETYSTISMPIKQAWSFAASDNELDAWAEISKIYGLDIRLYGFECGMEFCEEVEIINGEITMRKKIEYDDWVWECPMPSLGG